MGSRAIENRIRKLQEMEAGSFVIRWKLVTSSRLDGKALKAAVLRWHRRGKDGG